MLYNSMQYEDIKVENFTLYIFILVCLKIQTTSSFWLTWTSSTMQITAGKYKARILGTSITLDYNWVLFRL